mgnify:CR=1 FL=1
MELKSEVILPLMVGLVMASLTGLLALIWYRLRFYFRQAQRRLILAFLTEGLRDSQKRTLHGKIRNNPRKALTGFIEIMQLLSVNERRIKPLVDFILTTQVHHYFIRRLSSSNSFTRMEAAVYLGYLPHPDTTAALEKALSAERDSRVKLYLCNALADIGSPASIPVIVNSLLGEQNWYRTRVNMLLVSFRDAFAAYVPQIITSPAIEFKSLLIDFGSVIPCEIMRRYLHDQTDSDQKDIAYRAVRSLGTLYPRDVNCPRFVMHADPVICNIAIKSLAELPEKSVIDLLLPLLADAHCHESTVMTLSEVARKKPHFLENLIKRFEAETQPSMRDGLAKVLANRIEYFLLRLLGDQTVASSQVVINTIALGKYSGVISFLNRNHNLELENKILELLRSLMGSNKLLAQELQLYLKERIAAKLGLPPRLTVSAQKVHVQSVGKKAFLLSLLVVAVTIAPVTYILLHFPDLTAYSWQQHVVQFILDFNYFLAYYSLTINSLYLILLLLSFRAAHNQIKLWQLKKTKFLFKPRILPGISIIAPAFNEAETIVQNVRSLLNLRYPNYDLIVVNDGSPDNTLNKLIDEFQLEKIDMALPQKLKTMSILGVYANKSLPNLLIIDKANGGKADALNAGINFSLKEFVCTIDADSLIESDSLIKLTSLTLDTLTEAVALGGNIFPINGCAVDHGMIERTGIPRSALGRFQTIEYLRAFMAGRLGWSKINSLLIVSGAFGLFRKDRVIAVGGYLTHNERFQLDTVGEDMEMVVRLERFMLENKQPFSVLSSYNSNCWTEIPENLSVLYRQRDRWQRGLIDVIHFHRSMFLNPGYKQIGLIAMPYFVIFELLGPLLELQGYIMVILAFLLGLLSQEIAMLLFTASVLYGILVSIASLVITVEDTQYFSAKDLSILILYAIIENFGVRQLFSLWRITGFFSSLRSAQTWGSMPRKGFTVNS